LNSRRTEEKRAHAEENARKKFLEDAWVNNGEFKVANMLNVKEVFKRSYRRFGSVSSQKVRILRRIMSRNS